MGHFIGQGLVVYIPTPRTTSWAEFASKLTDPSAPYVRGPIGTFNAGNGLSISRNNLVVEMDRTTVYVEAGKIYPIGVWGSQPFTNYHATGVITPEVDSLQVEDSDFLATVSVGDEYYIKLGVNYSDPAESQWNVYRRVVAIEGSILRFDRPFDVTCEIYASYEALTALAGEWQSYKIGDFGLVDGGGAYKRGLGTSHGIKRITTKPTNVTVAHPTTLWLPETGQASVYGSWGFAVMFAENVRVHETTITNVCGSGVHIGWSENVLMDGVTITGPGRHRPFGPGTNYNSNYAAVGASGWGPTVCEIRNMRISGDNVTVASLEATCDRLVFNGIEFSSKPVAGQQWSPLFGKYGPGSVEFKNIRITGFPPTGSGVFPSYLNDTIIRNLSFEDTTPDDFLWTGRGDFRGTLRWGDLVFAESEQYEFSFTPTPASSLIPWPFEAIWMEVTLNLTSRNNISSINTGRGDLYQLNPGLTSLVAPPNYMQILRNTTYSGYQSFINNWRVYCSAGVQPITVVAKIRRRVS